MKHNCYISTINLMILCFCLAFSSNIAYANGQSDRTVPSEPTEVSAKSQSGSAIISFSPPKDFGGSNVTTYVVTSYPEGITAVGDTSPIVVNGLKNDRYYCFSIAAVNSTGFSNESLTNAVKPSAVPVVTEEERLAKIKEADSKRVLTSETVFLDADKMLALLLETRRGAVISLSPKQEVDISSALLTGTMLQSMSEDKAYFELKTNTAVFRVPAASIPFDSASQKLGDHLKPEEVNVKLQIINTPFIEVDAIRQAAQKQGAVLINDPLTFKVVASKHLKRTEIESLNAYADKMIEIPKGIDPEKITTAMVLNNMGQLNHVPTTFEKMNGKNYAHIKSLVNGTFVLVSHPISYTDMDNSTLRPTAKNLGSRFIMGALSERKFVEDRLMTRAEFVTCLVNALGLKMDDSFSRYSDVKNTDWFRAPVQAAYQYGLISGTGGGSFRPNDFIKREDAMVMIARALKWTGTSQVIEPNGNLANINRFADQLEITNTATYSVVKVLGTGILSGRSAHIFGKSDPLSRSEVAEAIEKLLRKSKLID